MRPDDLRMIPCNIYYCSGYHTINQIRGYSMTNYPSNEQIAEMVKQLTQARIENWLGEAFGHWRWWFLVVVFVLPWVIAYIFVDRKQLRDMALFSLIVMVFSITMDELGFALSMWNYPVEVIPTFPRLSSIDYAVLPVTYMLTYQYCPTWRSFFWGLIAVSTVYSFIIEPILVWMGIYVLIKWTHWYSWPIYIVMGLSSRWIIQKIIDIERKSNVR